jgi:hypothetical protein
MLKTEVLIADLKEHGGMAAVGDSTMAAVLAAIKPLLVGEVPA